MFSETFEPRFVDTDALGHINNTAIPIWFEGCRTPIFRWFTPDLDPKQWRIILARYTVEFHAEIFYQAPVEIRTGISRVGGSSFDVYQEVWQGGHKCASGTTVLVHFNHTTKKAEPIPDDIRQQMLDAEFCAAVDQ